MGSTAKRTPSLLAAVDLGSNSFHMVIAREVRGELQVVEPFLPEGTLRVGITSGASTPDRVVEDVISRLIDLADA